jgi:hypothetical protein
MSYSSRNIKIACNHAGLTHYGGVYFFHEFLRVLQFRHFLASTSSVCTPLWHGTSGGPSTPTMCAPPGGSYRCNTAAARVVGETAVRIPSTGTGGSAAGGSADGFGHRLAFRQGL